MPTSFYRVLMPLIADTNPSGMIRFLQERGLLASAMTCDECQVPMELTTRNRNWCAFKCPNYNTCKAIKPVRHGSSLPNMKVPIQKVVWIVYLWSCHNPVGMTAQMTDVSKKSIIQIYHFLREVCLAKLVALHGENFVDPVTGDHTQTNESYWRRKKGCLKIMKGKKWAALVPSYLDQLVWQDRFGQQGMTFDNILRHIAELYRI